MKKAYLIITNNEDLQVRIDNTLTQQIDPTKGISFTAVVEDGDNCRLEEIIDDLVEDTYAHFGIRD